MGLKWMTDESSRGIGLDPGLGCKLKSRNGRMCSKTKKIGPKVGKLLPI